MNKQKKQMILLGVILLMVIICFAVICMIPEKEEEDAVISYEVTSFEEDEIQKITFTNTNGTFSFVKDEDEWLYESDKSLDIDESIIQNMLKKLAKYSSENKITDVTDMSAYGLDDPHKKMLISDGTNSVTFLIGEYNNITYTYYMCLEDDPSTIYTMASSDLSIFDKTLEDMIIEPEEESSAEEETETLQE